RQPTLILSGDDDPLIPLANARLMNSLIPRSQLHVYHGGHLGLVTGAAGLAPVVGRFLAAGLPGDARDGRSRAAQNGRPGYRSLIAGVTEGCEIEPGAGEEPGQEAGPVLHPPEPGLDQRGELGEV